MTKSGLADSPFFAPIPDNGRQQGTPVFPAPEIPISDKPSDTHEISEKLPHGITVSRYHDTTVELIRRAVKEFGKEAATHRFTLSEKRAIANIIHALNMQGIRTTENEVTRIAINFIIDEFNRKGQDSLLGLVLQALNQ
jgi:hypothetical protein